MQTFTMRACWSASCIGGAVWLTSLGSPVVAQTAIADAQISQSQTVQQFVQQPQVSQPPAAQHPLQPAVDLAVNSLKLQDANIRDYSATVRKVERIDGKVGEPEYALIKVRNRPFSVYMQFIGPENLKGQECLYVEGQNDGKMFAHAPPGTLRYKFGTVSLAPNSVMAMKGQRYPITELGIYNLTKRLAEQGTKDMQYGECDVKFYKDYKVAGRPCLMIQVEHPVPRRNFIFHMAKIYVDDEWQIPIRYEAYDWPLQQGGEPQLLEEYTYMNIKLNEGYTDADFDVHNRQYQFNLKR
ncbi:MAG: DUF1571 domain-containing protein [Pirellulales bacterium]|nr:DUF1571 domain-containing protein [Pirellulales bacterium]